MGLTSASEPDANDSQPNRTPARPPDIEFKLNGVFAGPPSIEVRWEIRNIAEYTCKVQGVDFRFETTDVYAAYVRDKGLIWGGILVIDYHSPSRHQARALMSGERAEYVLNILTETVRELFRRSQAPFADSWSPDWVTVHIRLYVEGPDGALKEFESGTKLV